MERITITEDFDAVEVGDLVYQSNYYAQDKWREVTKITKKGRVVSLYLGKSAHSEFDTRTQIVGFGHDVINIKREVSDIS